MSSEVWKFDFKNRFRIHFVTSSIEGAAQQIEIVRFCGECTCLYPGEGIDDGHCLKTQSYVEDLTEFHKDCPLPECDFSMTTDWVEGFDEKAPGYTNQIKKIPTYRHYYLHWVVPVARKEAK